MIQFGLAEREIDRLVQLVRSDARFVGPDTPRERSAEEPGSPATAEAFARAAWTVIAEPADALAGELLGALGAAGALTALLEDDPAAALARAIAELPNAAVHEPAFADERLAGGVARWRPRVSAQVAIRALEQAARFACRLLLPTDLDWPSGLDDLGPKAPTALWARGRDGRLGVGGLGVVPSVAEHSSDVLAEVEAVAIIGARAATGYGEHVAAEFAAGIAERGAVVVSGGAYGIDGAAHRGALAAEGTTVAVLAGGLDRLYPAGHDALLRRIAGQGLLLAEVPCGTSPTRYRFLQRNRLIAAIAQSVVVIEAGARSGSLNTAGHAAEIGRPIGAVPGPITSASSAGCHRLLREFPATCVTNVAEVLALHRDGDLDDVSSGFHRPAPEALQVLDALTRRQGRDAADVARIGGLAESRARIVLGQLELEGAVTRGPDGWVRG